MRFETLDGMRGIAALLVAVYHFQQRQGLPEMHGYLAVDLFFVLSGFVIALTYVPRMAAGLGVRQFATDRFLRLYPLYAVGLILGFIAQVLRVQWQDPGAMDASHIAAAALIGSAMLPTPFDTALFPLNGAAWSLFFEMAVNLLFALALWRAPEKWILVLMVLAAIILARAAEAPLYLNLGWRFADAVPGAARALYSFAAGMLICRYLRLPAPRAGLGALVPIGLMVWFVLASVPDGGRGAWEMAVVTAAFPALILLAARIEPPATLRKPFSQLGALSYPLYATHWPLAALLKPALSRLPPVIGGAVFLITSLLVAQAAAHWIDAPVRAWIRRRRYSPPRGAAIAGA